MNTPFQPQPDHGNAESKVVIMPAAQTTQEIPTADPVAGSGENYGSNTVSVGGKRKRRTKEDLQQLKDAIAKEYSLGIPLEFMAKRLKIRIELLYKLFIELQKEKTLPAPPEKYIIIETPDVFKSLLKKFNFDDTGLLKVETSSDGSNLVVSTFEN